jgi:hypothetical protein
MWEGRCLQPSPRLGRVAKARFTENLPRIFAFTSNRHKAKRFTDGWRMMENPFVFQCLSGNLGRVPSHVPVRDPAMHVPPE